MLVAFICRQAADILPPPRLPLQDRKRAGTLGSEDDDIPDERANIASAAWRSANDRNGWTSVGAHMAPAVLLVSDFLQVLLVMGVSATLF